MMEDREILYRLWLLIKDIPEDPELCMRVVKVQKDIMKSTGAWARAQEDFDRKANSFD